MLTHKKIAIMFFGSSLIPSYLVVMQIWCWRKRTFFGGVLIFFLLQIKGGVAFVTSRSNSTDWPVGIPIKGCRLQFCSLCVCVQLVAGLSCCKGRRGRGRGLRRCWGRGRMKGWSEMGSCKVGEGVKRCRQRDSLLLAHPPSCSPIPHTAPRLSLPLCLYCSHCQHKMRLLPNGLTALLRYSGSAENCRCCVYKRAASPGRQCLSAGIWVEGLGHQWLNSLQVPAATCFYCVPLEHIFIHLHTLY